MLTKQILNYPNYTITNYGNVRNTITKHNLQSKKSKHGLAPSLSISILFLIYNK